MEVHGWHSRPIEFVAVGHLAVDYRQDRRILGGAAAYSCLTASRLGLAAAMVTAVGCEFDLFDPLENIEIHFHRSGMSTSFENIYQGASRRQRLLGRARPLIQDDLMTLRPRLAEDAAVLYCPVAGEVQAPLKRLTRRGLCGVAPQGFFRRWDEAGSIFAAPWHDAPEQLGTVDLVSASVTDPPQPEAFRQSVVDRVPLFVMTEGGRGARIFMNGRSYRVPAFLHESIDPTGAGDVFAASLLVALLEGMEPLEAAQFATCSASFAVEREGVEGIPPGRNEVLERLSVYKKRFAVSEIVL
jgi:hypothetical protein